MGKSRQTNRTLSPYWARTSFIMPARNQARQVVHPKSPYSMIVTGAVAGPIEGSTARRAGSTVTCCGRGQKMKAAKSNVPTSTIPIAIPHLLRACTRPPTPRDLPLDLDLLEELFCEFPMKLYHYRIVLLFNTLTYTSVPRGNQAFLITVSHIRYKNRILISVIEKQPSSQESYNIILSLP